MRPTLNVFSTSLILCRAETIRYYRSRVPKLSIRFFNRTSAAPDFVAHLIRNAKNGCFAEGLITRSVPLSSTIEVNGKPLSIEGITKD
ncbi:MAG: hypothetical protein HYU73_00395 [Betaproteobacteria bacterium]|nr:hypothetical protein [Betaproteobacteria bacterium]